MAIGVVSVVAEFQPELLIQETHAGIVRVRSDGKTVGRSTSFAKSQRAKITECLDACDVDEYLAYEYGTTNWFAMCVR